MTMGSKEISTQAAGNGFAEGFRTGETPQDTRGGHPTGHGLMFLRIRVCGHPTMAVVKRPLDHSGHPCMALWSGHLAIFGLF